MKKLLLFGLVMVFATAAFSQSTTLVINEVDYDIPGVDTTEFIEIKNVSASAINLSGYGLVLFNGANSTVYDTITFPNFMLQPNAYYVICGSGNYVPNCNQTETALADLIQNGSPDGMLLGQLGTLNIVDALSYEGDCMSPFIEGTGVTVANGDNNNDELVSLSRFPDGTDSNNNSIDFTKRCATPGLPNISPSTNCLSVITSVSSNIKEESIVYPNPANNSVNIKLGSSTNSNVNVFVYDFTGRLIENKKYENVSNVIEFETAHLAEGVYIFNVHTTDNIFTKKLTVLHQ